MRHGSGRGWRGGIPARVAAWLLALGLAACDETGDPQQAGGEGAHEGVEADPPFAVRGDCEGLHLAWFDAEGVHTADRRSDVPDARRAHVRVDSLRLAPEDRLDPDEVYVADLREPRDDGHYRVLRMSRDAFDAMVDRARGVAPAGAGGGDVAAADSDAADVVLYGASWCGACRAAASFLRERGVPFVEKDIEKDPAAAQELQRKARAAGVPTGSIPVIDFRGTLIKGFDRGALQRLIAESAEPI
jgi:arsenate reductase-like glutaredoxin family protein